MSIFNILALTLLTTLTFSACASQSDNQTSDERPLALIYKGPGSCEHTPGVSTGCSEASAHVAKLAGMKSQFVGPEGADPALMAQAKVWIQPGGRARIQTMVMSDKLKKQIRDFVQNGGGYVGFCAGGFMATEKFGWKYKDPESGELKDFEAPGLSLFPGKSFYYDFYSAELSAKKLAKIIPTKWLGVEKQVYWELGPYFVAETFDSDRVQVMAYYPMKLEGEALTSEKLDQDKALALEGTFGKGKVSISATHPEAPKDWSDYYKVTDSDGLDFDLAAQMIKSVMP